MTGRQTQQLLLHYWDSECLSVHPICCHASVIFRLCSREAMCQEEKKMPVLQAADPRAGERVPLQRLRQQGQTHSAVSPTESDGPVRCLPTHVLYHKKHKLYNNLSPLCRTWIHAVKNSNLERSCEGTTLLQLGFRGWGDCYFTHSRCSSSVATLWQLCGVMPLPYWCLLSFKIMAVFFF